MVAVAVVAVVVVADVKELAWTASELESVEDCSVVLAEALAGAASCCMNASGPDSCNAVAVVDMDQRQAVQRLSSWVYGSSSVPQDSAYGRT